MDNEQLFQLMLDKNWDVLSEKIRLALQKKITDPILKQVIHLFETEFLQNITQLPASEKLAKMRNISLIIESDRSSFGEDFTNKFIHEKLLTLEQTKDPNLVSYAATYQDMPQAKKILQSMKKNMPEKIATAKNPSAKIEATTLKNDDSKIIPLFKSQQEKLFYFALQEVYTNCLIYPNVSMSCTLDIERIKNKLNPDLINYFYKAIFDFVIFEINNYVPIHFFELDSPYHDHLEAKKRDGMKNEIANIAGIKLTRIREFDKDNITISNFKKLLMM